MENKKQEDRMDIFDRIMAAGPLKKLEPFYKKNKEILLYLFFGGMTTVVGLIFYILPARIMDLQDRTLLGLTIDMNTQVSNIISWICAVSFAYVTNRIWVFSEKAHGRRGIVTECLSFFGGRLLTLIIENILLNICTTAIGLNDVLAKVLVSVVTIILNYVISKLFIFRARGEEGKNEQ